MITLAQLEGEGKASGRLIRKRGRQIDASDVIANLKKWRPADGFAVMAVTMSDIFKGEFNFLYGLAGLHLGVVSLHRLHPDSPSYDYEGPTKGRPDEMLLRHTMDVLTHELGHSFGLRHCTYFSCVMQGFNCLEEAEGHAPDLCPVCLRKFLWIANTQSTDQVRARYERMLDFYEGRPGFERPQLCGCASAPPHPQPSPRPRQARSPASPARSPPRRRLPTRGKPRRGTRGRRQSARRRRAARPARATCSRRRTLPEGGGQSTKSS